MECISGILYQCQPRLLSTPIWFIPGIQDPKSPVVSPGNLKDKLLDYPGIYQAIEFLYPSKDFLSFSVFLYLYLYFMYLSSFLHQTGKAGESVGRAGDELPGFPPPLTQTPSHLVVFRICCICILHLLYLLPDVWCIWYLGLRIWYLGGWPGSPSSASRHLRLILSIWIRIHSRFPILDLCLDSFSLN